MCISTVGLQQIARFTSRFMIASRVWPCSTLAILFLACVGCTNSSDSLFDPVPSQHSGVHFSNPTLRADSLLQAFKVNHTFSDGGVAMGDLNNDGRPDLYFAGNVKQENELYLNQGNLQFREVTADAGVGLERTSSKGVALVDINQDGLLDIYVSVGGPASIQKSRANRLLVNQGVGEEGIPQFEERAEAYGIADSSYTTQAAFFDYDQDGDLDLYLLNNVTQARSRITIDRKLTDGQASNTDRLYRNNRDGTFTDVSAEAGIQIEGHGLGVAISDVNKDGWPDVYVANDFISNDLLYVNNGEGTFTNRIDEYVKHQSYSSMGVDVADVNNDRWNDIFVLDMLPPGNWRNKMMLRYFDQKTFEKALQIGYEPQYVRNMLQINNGPTPNDGLSFSEVGQLAGIEATDWSWASLLADYDNDGDRDLFVTNGYGKDMTNLDFSGKYQQVGVFGTEEAQQKKMTKLLEDLPRVTLPNYFFENEGELRFADRTGEWAASPPGLSSGAAMGDLDGDGDLDLVVNNMDEKATILENRASERDSSHALRVDLHGPDGNRGGLGTKLTLHNGTSTQYYDHSPYRGFESTVQPIAHFGLGADSTADSLEVMWPDGKTQLLTDLSAGQVLDVRYEAASLPSDSAAETPSDSLRFHDVAAERGLTYRHREREVNEFERTPILPHKLSMDGPALAVGDVNGNGRDDVLVGADRGHPTVLFRQTTDGQFRRDSLAGSARYEDRGALFFDADGDGDRDLYVVSGGPVRAADSTVYQDRFYHNENGTLQRVPDALPTEAASGSVVTAADYDADEDLDLFVGGRVRPGEYPLPPRSFLLRNDSEDGTVQFTDVTDERAPELADVGMVTDALWTDYDADGQLDLMVVGEWMPITIFENEGSTFSESTEQAGLGDTAGWWMSLEAGDFDSDGDTEYVAGNLGLNTRYEASPEQPMRIHAEDYDGNGAVDPVLTQYVEGTEVPVPRRDEIIAQIPGLKARFPTYDSYAQATFTDVFTERERADAYVREAVRFETSYLENEGDGTLSVRALPRSVQTAPVFGMETGDFDADGHLDMLMTGNWYAPSMRTGRLDAFVGAYLKGDGTGRFSVQDGTESGFFVDGDAKATARVATGDGSSLVLATQNDDSLQAFRPRPVDSMRTVQLRPLDQSAVLHFADGKTRRTEFYYGSSYLSQSSRVLRVPPGVERVVVRRSTGERRTLTMEEGTLAAGQER